MLMIIAVRTIICIRLLTAKIRLAESMFTLALGAKPSIEKPKVIIKVNIETK